MKTIKGTVSRFLLAALAGWLWHEALAYSQTAWSPRTEVAAWVFVEGAEVDPADFTAQMVKGLRDAGMNIVEGAPSSGSRLNAKDAFSSMALPALVSKDNQAAILVKAEVSEPQKAAEAGWRSVLCRLLVRIVRLSSGAVGAELSETTAGDDLYLNVAIDKALSKAVARAAGKIPAAVIEALKTEAPVVLDIEARSSPSAASELKNQIGSVAGVLETKLLRVTTRSSRFELRIGTDVSTFCKALGEAFSNRLVIAGDCGASLVLRPRRTLNVALFSFENRTREVELDYLAEAGAVFVEAALLNVPFSNVVRPSSGRYFVKLADLAPLVKEGKVDALCKGKIEKTKTGMRIEVSFLDAQAGRHLWSFSHEAGLSQAGRLLGEISSRVESQLVEKLVADKPFSRRPEIGELLQASKASAREADFSVNVSAIFAKPLFSRLAEHYRSRPPVRFKLKNAGQEHLSGIRSAAGAPLDMAAGAETEGSFCPADFPVGDRTVATLDELAVSYSAAGVDHVLLKTVPLLIFGRAYADVSDLDTLLPFVTPEEKTVSGFAAGIKLPENPAVSPALLKAASVLRAIQSAGIKIVPEAAGTLKKPRLPCQALLGGSASKTDMALLAASIFMAMGLKTGFVAAGDALLVALDTGLPTSASHQVSFVRDRLLRSGNRVLIALDPWAGKLMDAWDSALHAVKAAAGKTSISIIARSGRELVSKVQQAEECKADLASPPSSAGASADIEEFVKVREVSYETALKEIKRRLASDRHDLDAINQAGILYAKAGKLSEAARQFKAALRESTSDPRSANNMGNTLLLLGKLEEARENYSLAVSQKKRLDRVYANLAILSWVKEDAKEALENFKLSVSRGGHEYLKSSGILSGHAAEPAGPVSVFRADLRRLGTLALGKSEAGSVDIGISKLSKEGKALGEGTPAAAFATTVLFWWE